MMKKRFLICMAGILLTSAAAAACSAVTAKTADNQTESASAWSDDSENPESAVRFGRVKYIEGSSSFVIEYGDMEELHDGYHSASANPSRAAFLACGELETVALPDTVPITASVGGVESEAASYQIGPGSLLKLQFSGSALRSVTILNDEPAAFAEQIKAAFLSEDTDLLDGLMSYPCYVTFSPGGRGWIIKNREDLSVLSESLFTESFLNSIEAFDTASIDPIQANVIMGPEGGAPAVTFHIDSNGTPGITGISAAD